MKKTRQTAMRKHCVGTFAAYHYSVRLYVDPTNCSGMCTTAGGSGAPEITVGVGTLRWEDVLDTLLHEILELAMILEGCRLYTGAAWHPDHREGSAHSVFLIRDHDKFELIVRYASTFCTSGAVEAVRAAWKKYVAQSRSRA